jgi:hypothetical protein
MTDLEALRGLQELVANIEKIRKSFPSEDEIDSSLDSEHLKQAFHEANHFLDRAQDTIRIKTQEFENGTKPTASFL